VGFELFEVCGQRLFEVYGQRKFAPGCGQPAPARADFSLDERTRPNGKMSISCLSDFAEPHCVSIMTDRAKPLLILRHGRLRETGRVSIHLEKRTVNQACTSQTRAPSGAKPPSKTTPRPASRLRTR
jgi:hypothetical protein